MKSGRCVAYVASRNLEALVEISSATAAVIISVSCSLSMLCSSSFKDVFNLTEFSIRLAYILIHVCYYFTAEHERL